MLLAGGNGPQIIEPTEVPTPVVETLVDEVQETTVSATEQSIPLSEGGLTSSDVGWIGLLFFLIAFAGIAFYQTFRKKVIKK